MERVIITVGNGLIARHLLKRLLTNKECSNVLVANTRNLVDRQLQETTPITFYAADIRESDAISNLDNETQYRSTFKVIKNINKTDNVVEVTISAGPQNNTSHQLVTFYPEQMKIQMNLTEGLITGSRILELERIYDNKSKVLVIWNIELSGIPIMGRSIAENSIKQTTVQALLRVAEAVE